MEQCRERMIDLHDAYIDVILSPFGGWDPEEHFVFDVIFTAYTHLKLPTQFQVSWGGGLPLGVCVCVHLSPSLSLCLCVCVCVSLSPSPF